ncbi:MAG: ATP-binding cassette domain-containing protein [Dorea sp.]|nr:ATP-binding cassette domain-containing protein [Dorea sp.]
MVEFSGLRAGFGKKEILHGIDLAVKKKKITAIIGQSGCGKTTLLKTVNRILEDEGGYIQGKITVDGQDIMKISKEELRKRVGIVFQQPIAFPYSIEKNLTYVLKYHYNLSKEELKKRCEECLREARLYDEVKEQMSMSAAKLSGGQKQRLAIARSLCVNPELMLLDEPCSALDMKNTMAIEEMLLELKEQYTIVIVTHNLAQAQRIADDIVFMNQGKVLEITEKNQFFSEPFSELAKEQVQYM